MDKDTVTQIYSPFDIVTTVFLSWSLHLFLMICAYIMQRLVDLKQVFSWFEKCVKVCIVYRKILWSTWLSGHSFVSVHLAKIEYRLTLRVNLRWTGVPYDGLQSMTLIRLATRKPGKSTNFMCLMARKWF